MKLKMFIRGLGAGIILGALLMLVAYLASGAYKMSDDDIKARAKRLGMIDDPRLAMATASDGPARVMDDQTTANATTEAVAEKETTDEKVTTEKETTTEEKTTETTTEATTTEETTTEATTTEEVTTEKETTEEKTTEEKTTEEKTTENKPGQKTKVTIKVTAGMYSELVSDMLADAGLVKSSDDFNSFLIKI